MIIDSKILQDKYATLLYRAAPEKVKKTEQLLKDNDITFQKSDGEENHGISTCQLECINMFSLTIKL